MSVSLSTCIVPPQATPSTALTVNEEQLVHQALRVLEQRLFQRGPRLIDPQSVRHYLRLALAGEKNEVFAVLFLDTRHRVLAFEPLFQGTVDSAAVYPRYVVQRALAHNSAAVILVHNHPSGCAEPSHNDVVMTQQLKILLEGIQVRVLDHFIIGEGEPYSFAESGRL
ncbi:DNA repair protein RadC [Pseudomonas sp. R4-34-07]|uniref:RadC family protein n=1 Tax=Pseudomonas sp. R4-34-07 TaxID=658642 RepID=UPI000F583651|nr:DNA repair protein RadC [Pseudomonas sp. R4-34-07]AZF53188.1 DNA repair protein RadC [Pseudomonas sp. R4-34-07]